MTPAELEAALFEALRRVAPEADPAAAPRDRDLREAFDIDSMDFLSFVTRLHDLTGAEIAERDYPRLYTLSGALAFLSERTGRRS